MKYASGLEVTTPSECEILMTRAFDAPRRLVFDAFTKPELVSRWIGILEGWSMPVCEIDLRIGGEYRYLWRGPEGMEMGMRGRYLEIEVPARIVNTEKFDEAWYTGEAVDTVTMEETGNRTKLSMLVRYDSREIRDSVLASPMTEGIEAGYANLDAILAALVEETPTH